MSRNRLSGDHGMTLIEVSVTILVIAIGTLATLGTYAHFSKATSTAKQRAVLTSLAQREIEQLRPVAYSHLSLNANPPTVAAVEGPRTGRAAQETLAVDATNGVVRPGGDAFAIQGAKGRVYRYVTMRPVVCGGLSVDVRQSLSSLLSQTVSAVTAAVGDLCAVGSTTKRITVVVVPERGGEVGTPVRISTIVSDPSTVTTAVVDSAKLSLEKAVTTVATAVPSVTTAESTLRLADTRCDSSVRTTPSPHATRDTSQAGLNCTSSGPAPTLMLPAAIPNDGQNLPTDFATDVDRVADGGLILQRDTQAGSCTASDNLVYTNAETETRKHSIHTWASTPVPGPFETPLTGGLVTFTLWTATANAVKAPGRLCVTLRRSSTGEVLGSSDFKLVNWPDGPTQLVTAFNVPHVSFGSSERLLLTLRVPKDSGADIQIIYDHHDYPSYLSIPTLTGKGW